MARSSDLRERAEDVLRQQRDPIATSSGSEHWTLEHEAHGQLIEVELQNEAMQESRAAAERAEARARELFQDAPVAHVIVDRSGTITELNAEAARMFRAAGERTLRGRMIVELIAEQDWPKWLDGLTLAQRASRSDCEVWIRRADATFCYARLSIRCLPTRDERFVSITDLTELRQAQAALDQLTSEVEARVERRGAELQAQNLELRNEIVRRAGQGRGELEARPSEVERMRGLAIFAAGMAHDFNNVLVRVVGEAQLALTDPELPERFRPALSTIEGAGREAAELTRQLLLFAGHGQLELAAVDLVAVVRDALGRLPDGAGLAPRIDVRLPHGLEPVAADLAQVKQLVRILLDNALEAVGEAGTITVRARLDPLDASALAAFQHASAAQPGRFAVLEIADTGPGIEPAQLGHIFDPFFTTKDAGRGLGLAVALGIVHSHRGALRVRTRPGEGCSFEAALPLAAAAQPAREDAAPPRAQPVSVLFVDDDPGVQRVVPRLLGALGYRVTAADSGARALALLREDPDRFDLVVLDWLMPGMSGQQVLAELRRLRPELPVVLASGCSLDELPASDAHTVKLQKPAGVSELRAAIARVTGAG